MPKKNEPYFNINSFILSLKEFKESKGPKYNWNDVVFDSGVSSRIIKSTLEGNIPGLLNIIKLCNWMGENIYDFIEYTNDKTFNPISIK